MEEDIIKIELKDEIDLHFFHPKDVKAVLKEFIDSACEQGYKKVRIAHGKGRSVIKNIVLKELEKNENVLSFKDDSGNWGATIAFLKEGKLPIDITKNE